MDVAHVKPFIDSTISVLGEFGIKDIKKGGLRKSNGVESSQPVTILVGIVGDVKGNVTYNLPKQTAINLASTMMMGLEVLELDDMAKSALSELANMITGGASAIFEIMKKKTDISPPTLIFGDNIAINISKVETIIVELVTSVGNIELNIGLEV